MKAWIPLITLVCWSFSRQGSRWPGLWLSMDLLIGGLVELKAAQMALHYENNLAFYNVYGPVEVGLKMALASALMSSRKWNKVIIAMLVVYLAFLARDLVALDPLKDHLSWSALIGAAFIAAIYTRILFSLAEDETLVLYAHPEFWLALAFVVYYGGMLPLVGLLGVLTERDQQLAGRLFIINDVLYYTCHALIVLASFMFRRHGHTAWKVRT